MSDIFDYNFAFEVDLEKMTGRYVFNTGEIEHIAAEKKNILWEEYYVE